MAGRAQAPGLGLMEPAQFPTLPCTLLPLPAPPGTHHFPLPDLLSEACPESVPRGGGRHGAMTNGRNEEKRGGGGQGTVVVLRIEVHAMLLQQRAAQGVPAHLRREVQRAAPVAVPHRPHAARAVLIRQHLRRCVAALSSRNPLEAPTTTLASRAGMTTFATDRSATPVPRPLPTPPTPSPQTTS